ncbi:MAG: SufD family Fe-S cluster assembly protein [Bacteroidetes bacterium]|nr:SufD family Fe-S cluster assembly protein [Bacteroidota bacterium]
MQATLSGIDLKEKLQEYFVLRGADALSQIRKEAFRIFQEKGFPTTRHEDWKYTSLLDAFAIEWNLVSEENSFTKEDLKAHLIPDLESHILVLVDGVFQPQLSTILSEESGIEIKSFASAIKENKNLVEAHFAQHLSTNFNGLVALNTALAFDGIFVFVPKGKTVKHPIQILNLNGGNNQFSNTRNLIIAEENAALNLVEVYASQSKNSSFSNVVTEISAAENARVNNYKLQLQNDNSHQINTTQITQKKNSLVNTFTVTLGGKLVRNDLNFNLADSHIESHLYGLYIPSAEQHFDNHSFVDHAQPNGFSNEFYKGIMLDKGRGVFNGKIMVRQDAQKTNAYQSNKNILLSNEAKVDTKPQLEIFADDVKCSHGATVGVLMWQKFGRISPSSPPRFMVNP